MKDKTDFINKLKGDKSTSLLTPENLIGNKKLHVYLPDPK